jgi:hypothetical protein
MHNDQPCKHCGRCPTCGQQWPAVASPYVVPYNPWVPVPVVPVQPWYPFFDRSGGIYIGDPAPGLGITITTVN